jgi:long-chain fatty acid transport protein
MKRIALFSIAASLLAASAAVAQTSGVLRSGVDARSLAMGGADAPSSADPTSALAANPAGLAALDGFVIDVGVAGLSARGAFSNAPDPNGSLDEAMTFVPDVVAGGRIGRSPIRWMGGVVTHGALGGTWRFMDAPGGVGGVSYGRQDHRSAIGLLRVGGGAAWAVNDRVSIGASLGRLFNANELRAPYIFQEQPQLAGLKTLLDIETRGWGWFGTVGALVRAGDRLDIGGAYHSSTTIRTHGQASGDVGEQLATLGLPLQAAFRYDAVVGNRFPQGVKIGAAWAATPRLSLRWQEDWLDWSAAFAELPIALSNGDNPDINGVLGSDAMEDAVPLDWRDQWVHRVGAEYRAAADLWIRAGYAYGRSPVPDSTLTPMTAAIAEHALSGGFGYVQGRYGVDVAMQFSPASSRTVRDSVLRSGEYDGTIVEVGGAALVVRTRFSF